MAERSLTHYLIKDVSQCSCESKYRLKIKDTLTNYFDENHYAYYEEDEADNVHRWLNFVDSKPKLKTIENNIPDGILPKGWSGALTDVKIFVKHGPDDAAYDSDATLRQQIARGNCVLTLHQKGQLKKRSLVVQALKKFTGGLGDDDDRDDFSTANAVVWKKYFLEPIESTKSVVCMKKANGEAAHLSAVSIDEQKFLCVGSKNVHMLVRNRDDINKYVGGRYQVAREVAETVVTFVEHLEERKRKLLLEFLCLTHLTAVFELCSAKHQHVVNLSSLKEPRLYFIAWTSSRLDAGDTVTSLCALPPDIGIEVAVCLGLDTVQYSTISPDDVDDHMNEVRQGYDYEGEVLYFVTSAGDVIGLLKKKTIWYVVLRAIREKARRMCRDMDKGVDVSVPSQCHRVESRIGDIQTWLGFSKEEEQKWKKLGCGFVRWLVEKHTTAESVANVYPVVWKNYLDDTKQSDNMAR